jgi:cyanophycinase
MKQAKTSWDRCVNCGRLALAAALMAATLPAAAGKLYMMGGGYADKNTDLFVNGLRRATGIDTGFVPNVNSTNNCGADWATTRCPRIAVVTSASSNLATGLDAFQNDLLNPNGSVSKRGYHNLFQTHGFSPRFITAHVDNHTTHSHAGNAAGDANIAILQQADVVFFTGGDQAKIARTWLRDDGSDTPLAATLRARWNGGFGTVVIAGDSAGTHILNATMHGVGISYGYLYFGADLPFQATTAWQDFGDTREGTSALRYYDNGSTMKGLGFLPTALLSDTHFDSRSGRLGRLIAAQRDLAITQGLGVDEDTGALVDTAASTVQVFGSGVLIVADTAQASVQAGTHHKVNGVRASLLTAGDSYNYSGRTVTSSKAAITSRYYSGRYDSKDIFAAYETSKSLTRLVDQTDSVNIGSAPRPNYSSNPKYPTTAPTIRLRFTRDAVTKGHYANRRYTVVKALVDIY